MAAKKKKKKRKQHGTREQRALRAHARRARSTLPSNAELRIEPKGEAKMSEVLQTFVEPYLELADTEPGREVLIHLAAVAWNAALLPDEEQMELLGDALDKGLPDLEEKQREEFTALLFSMVDRKRAFFDENKRFILSVEVTDKEHGFYVSVVSTSKTS